MAMATSDPERQRQLEPHLPADIALDELLQSFRDLAAFGRNPAIQFLGDFLGSIARPAFDWIESNHPQWLILLTGEKILDDRRDVRVAFVGLAPSRAGTEVLKHEVDVPIEPIGGNDRGRLTHTHSESRSRM